MSNIKSEHPLDDENPAPRISNPRTEPFNYSSNMSKSHRLEQKVKGRYYNDAKNEILSQGIKCDNIDAQLVTIEARLQQRVSDIPAGSLNLKQWDELLTWRLDGAHRAVQEVRQAADENYCVMTAEQQPRFWQLKDERTWRVINAIEKSDRHMEEMKEVLSSLEDMLVKIEGWSSSDLTELEDYLYRFVFELREWREDITSQP